MEEVFVQVLERFMARILSRQRAMYAADAPFIEKWRAAMGFIDVDLDAGYPKIWFELQAMAWNRPVFRERIVRNTEQWDDVLTSAVTTAMAEYGLDRERFSPHAIATLVRTFNEGLLLERLNGFAGGHSELLALLDGILQRWEDAREP